MLVPVSVRLEWKETADTGRKALHTDSRHWKESITYIQTAVTGKTKQNKNITHRQQTLEEKPYRQLVYDILSSTTDVFSYAIGSRKQSSNEHFFVGAQTVVSLLQTTEIKQGVSLYLFVGFCSDSSCLRSGGFCLSPERCNHSQGYPCGNHL